MVREFLSGSHLGQTLGLIKDEVKQVDKDLDELRYLSESVGNAKQFDSIQFIRKDK